MEVGPHARPHPGRVCGDRLRRKRGIGGPTVSGLEDAEGRQPTQRSVTLRKCSVVSDFFAVSFH